MKFLLGCLSIALLSFPATNYAAAASDSSVLTESTTEDQLKAFSKLGKSALLDHHEALLDLWQHDSLDPELIAKIHSQVADASFPELNHLADTYQKNFTTMAVDVQTIFNGAYNQSYTCDLTEEERAFCQLGLGLTYLTLDNPLSHARNTCFKEGLKAVFDYYLGIGMKIFFSNPGGELAEASSAASAPLPVDQEQVELVKRTAQLNYAFLIKTPVTESLRPWDLAQTAGWWALMQYGKETYLEKEKSLFHDPMVQRFQALTQNANAFKTEINYDTLTSHSGKNYSDLGSQEEKFKQFFMEDLGHYINASLQGSFLADKDHRSFEQGIQAARATKAMSYKAIADLVVGLYPALSAQEYKEKVSTIVEKDWALKEMKTLFNVDGTPNRESYLWGELIFGYTKATELGLTPSSQES